MGRCMLRPNPACLKLLRMYSMCQPKNGHLFLMWVFTYSLPGASSHVKCGIILLGDLVLIIQTMQLIREWLQCAYYTTYYATLLLPWNPPFCNDCITSYYTATFKNTTNNSGHAFEVFLLCFNDSIVHWEIAKAGRAYCSISIGRTMPLFIYTMCFVIHALRCWKSRKTYCSLLLDEKGFPSSLEERGDSCQCRPSPSHC